MVNSTDLERCKELRKEIFLLAESGGMAHLASSFSCVEILYTLYEKKILSGVGNLQEHRQRDRLILSKGHAGIALYCVLMQAGLLDRKDAYRYLQPEGRLGGEPCMRDMELVEASTGSLGHGLSMGVGMAIAQKKLCSDAKTYVILGDGECEEGTIWEAVMSASAFGLNNLIAVLDCNTIQKMMTVKETIGMDNWLDKFTAFGWDVVQVNGHDVEALCAAFRGLQREKPHLVLAHTVKGKGVSLMENSSLWHFRMPKPKEMKCFLSELGITEQELERACKEHI